MGYKVPTKIRIDLGELGDNQGTPFFVEIKNTRMMTYDEKMEFATAAQALKSGSDKDQPEITKEKIQQLKNQVKSLIVSWNLIDMNDESPVNIQDEDALDRVPGEVIEAIFKELGKNAGHSKETKNSSEQSDKS